MPKSFCCQEKLFAVKRKLAITAFIFNFANVRLVKKLKLKMNDPYKKIRKNPYNIFGYS